MKRSLPFVLVVLLLSSTRIYGQPFQISGPFTSVCANNSITATGIFIPANVTSFTWTISPPEPLTPGNPLSQAGVTFTNCGSHTIACIAFNGSNPVAFATVMFNVNCPGVTVSPLTQTLCPGNTATITANGASSYTWSTSENTSVITPTPLSTIVYSVLGNFNNCVATATVNVENIVIATIANSVCVGRTTTLSAFGANTYTWAGSSFAGSVFQPSLAVGPGSYTVFGNTGLCPATMSIGIAPPLNVVLSASGYSTCISQNYPNSLSVPVTLSASGASTFTWAGSNPPPPPGPTVVVRPSVSTCYTVTGLTAVCSGTAVTCVSVTPQFTVQVYHKPQVCKFEPTTMSIVGVGATASGPVSSYNYLWTVAPGNTGTFSALNASSVSVVAILTFTYITEVTDAQNCISAPKSGTLFIAICDPPWGMGIESLKKEDRIFYIPTLLRTCFF